MHIKEQIAKSSFTPTLGTHKSFLMNLPDDRCGNKQSPSTHFLTVLALIGSLFFHTSIIACGILFSRTFPPTPMATGGLIEVSLMHLPTSDSGLQPSGPKVDAPSTARGQTIEKVHTVSTSTSSTTRKETEFTRIQPRKSTQVSQPPQENQLTGNHAGSKKRPQAVASGQGAGGEGTGHGHGGSGNGGPPAPLGTHVNPWPTYPELARQRSQEGQVILLVNVDKHGNPTKVQIDQSSGHVLLDETAIKTIMRWKFNPASRNGEAVSGKVKVPVTFRLQ